MIFLKQSFSGNKKFWGGIKEILGGTAPECPLVATGLVPARMRAKADFSDASLERLHAAS